MQPPRLAEIFLRLCSPADDADAIAGDLTEGYCVTARAGDTRRAEQWYIRQVVASAPSLLALRFRRIARGRGTAAGAVAIALGVTAVLLVFRALAAADQILYTTSSPDLGAGARVVAGVAAFVVGGFVTACAAKPGARGPVASVAALCVGISVFALLPVLPIVIAAGAGTVAYHALLLALVAPSVIAGARLRRRRSPG